MHLLCTYVFTLYLYLKKYQHVITSVINFCNYIYNYTVDSVSTVLYFVLIFYVSAL